MVRYDPLLNELFEQMRMEYYRNRRPDTPEQAAAKAAMKARMQQLIQQQGRAQYSKKRR